MDILLVTDESPSQQAKREMTDLVAQRNRVLVETPMPRCSPALHDLNHAIQKAAHKRIALELARIHYRIN